MSNWRRVAWFFIWFPLWYPIWKGEDLRRKLSGRHLRRGLKGAFPDVRPGDIFVIRLHSPSPWGTWAHSAIAIDGRYFCHGFANRISAHPIDALPVRYAIAQLRVRCGEGFGVCSGPQGQRAHWKTRVHLRRSWGAESLLLCQSHRRCIFRVWSSAGGAHPSLDCAGRSVSVGAREAAAVGLHRRDQGSAGHLSII